MTDGTTLLGADDKAGIAEIISAVVYLQKHPEIVHGNIRIAFNPDEEIGRGAHNFDVERFGADLAYTMDGGEIGELEYENFNAAVARVTFKGRNVHPGYAKHKMINSIARGRPVYNHAARWERPNTPRATKDSTTSARSRGSVENRTHLYHPRPRPRPLRGAAKKELVRSTRKINNEFPGDEASNRAQRPVFQHAQEVEPHRIIDKAQQAMEMAGVEPQVVPIRGGTDGARLSFKGPPLPQHLRWRPQLPWPLRVRSYRVDEKAVAAIVECLRLAARKQ